MNPPTFINDCSQTQISNPPITPVSVSVESVESSVRNLIKSWCRRQRWKLFFNPEEEENLNPSPSWKKQLTKFLESTPVRVLAISLLLSDLILTILELSSSLLSCKEERDGGGDDVHEVWYRWLGIAILGLLCVKTLAMAVGLGRSFFKHPGYVVDGVVLMGALFLEAFLERKGGGLLVVVSLWRVVRVVESAFELSDEAIEAQVEAIVCQFEALREENRKLLETIAEKDSIIKNLQEIIEKLQVELNHREHKYNRELINIV